MSKPRIFVSSTYYDLKNLRNDLERFITNQGYESILNEDGKVTYSKEEKLEDACYREVQRCDIVIAIIGGRRGSNSSDFNYSISNKELKTALEHGKQVYIFIENSVYNEYGTYLQNKENESIKYAAVDDKRIYRFIEELQSLPLNNVTQSFIGANDIIAFLREQWAELFQRLLENNMRQKEINTIDNLNNISNTLHQMVMYLKQTSDSKDITINEILFSSHPALIQLRSLLHIPVKIMLGSFDEICSLLKWFGYKQITQFTLIEESSILWQKNNEKYEVTLIISSTIFDEKGTLKLFQSEEWNDEWITKEEKEVCFDDDIPF